MSVKTKQLSSPFTTKDRSGELKASKFLSQDSGEFDDTIDDINEEPKSAEVKRFHSHGSSLAKFTMNGLCDEESKSSGTPQFSSSMFLKPELFKREDFAESICYELPEKSVSEPLNESKSLPRFANTVDVFEDYEKFISLIKSSRNIQNGQVVESNDIQEPDTSSQTPLELQIDCEDSNVLFVKLESLLVCESPDELENLQLLIRIRKNRRKNSKRKSTTSVFSYIYLRPFMKPFLRFAQTHFKLILFSYKDSKTLEVITDSINAMFEKDIFEAYISLPSARQEKKFNLRMFMNPQEGRTLENSYVMDTCQKTWAGPNTIPMTQFDGFCKDNTLFLCQRFIERAMNNYTFSPELLASEFSS